MNILLIYPEFPDTFWSFRHALKFTGKKAASQPLGLLTIAALLPQEWNKKMLDLNITELDSKLIEWADYVFISAMGIQKKFALEVIKKCNALSTKVVAGGPLFTAEYALFGTVDHFVLNEAELTLPGFIDDVKHGTPKRIYTSEGFADIWTTPPPVWDLVDFDSYATMNIQFSRGCPFNCDFCNITTLFGHYPRTKSTKQMINELDLLYAAGWRKTVFFVDDNFIGNKQILKNELLPAIIEWQKGKKPLVFTTEVSINLSDDPVLIDLMVQAGFDTVFIGIETPDELSLVECNKKQNLNRNLIESVQLIQRSGLQVQAGFILGFDNDTHSTFKHLIDFIQSSGIVTAMVGLLQAPADTLLYERLAKEGRINDLMTGDNTDGTTNIVPIMELDDLISGYKHVVDQLYSPKLYFKRVKTFFKEYKVNNSKSGANIMETMRSIVPLLRSIVILGIADKARFQYWKIFFWALVRKPSMLNLSITFAVYGYHFRAIIERQIL